MCYMYIIMQIMPLINFMRNITYINKQILPVHVYLYTGSIFAYYIFFVHPFAVIKLNNIIKIFFYNLYKKI